MGMSATRSLAALAAAAALVVTACDGAPADASSAAEGIWPTGAVDMLVGYAAGGSSDLVSRAVAKGLAADLDQPFRVINRQGDNGAAAAADLAGAPADGTMLSIQNASLYTITPLAVAPDKVRHIDDVDVVHGISSENYVLVTTPQTGLRTFTDLQTAQRPLRYGTTGVGTGAQLSGALLMKGAGVLSQAVPFDSGAPNLAAVLANDVDIAVIHVGEAIENIDSGKLVALNVFSPERIDFLPDVPTARELGYDVVVSQYRFMTVPKGTPAEVTGPLVAGLKATFASAAYQRFNEQNSLTPMEIPGDQVLARLTDDARRYAEMVVTGGIDLRDIG
ncbi:ABC transporter substrate-binding protein [Mycolicibacterium neoaurum]|uniref:ABC transporter substrate-binding protein n=2 Tax=Mycobacteriaceae TaxID=1762 RepID=V5X6D2_MYCNE|nr:ABC transporter substrate-binding protein [Mycolicibacterium neoaurum VKM Ac-1815D]AMO04101.1 ABC transporter substrate-binding protein [Mycolicibacterium neoaurum]AXK77629.1 tripartite tricarboxylate transporter substrate binding protein [Mycolicibacterium neoaurum]KJQ49890.1 ABC transporter substrate-binding protein [Mycolicibacterium neoaurum]KUM07679.1 ABC transporter substrate-binding protein [Mycolicibacterium neoaurum]